MSMRWRALAGTSVTWMTLLFAGELLAGEREVSCWKASEFDQDGDGYAVRNAHKDDRVTFETSGALALTCPAGWVKARGDCDDSDPSIFPRRHEVYGNDVDDNCDGRNDEPTFFYSPNGYDTTHTSFTMRVRIHEPAVVAAYQSSFYTLAYKLEYQRLSDTSYVLTTDYQTVSSLGVGSSYAWTSAALTGLAPESGYRVRVRFYQKRRALMVSLSSGLAESTGSRAYTDSYAPAPSYAPSAWSYLPVGETSAWYYTATSSSYELGRARTGMIRRALYETYLSGVGYSGYRGYGRPDGTRYGADLGEKWCSEFYSWVADQHLTGVGHRANVSSVRSYFETRGAWRSIAAPDDYVYYARPGDYVAMDTSDDGKKNHSAMFLAYDLASGRLWTVDGNTSGRTDLGDSYDSRRAGNEAFVRDRDPTVALGWGRVRYEMIRR